ncbi:CHC2 zinc finger domain-containing protein [Psychrobacter sp. 72-O-c]|uniref:CHC2 zinc finger domain-containing protein n=1 Tax=Psychrobacter sp. 72-O-c TaxID=2774125 RepID=UPI0019186035|nr:CHC2 zinc finger domain-containing protein [Psychrobacter sp. 72-O-c]
MTDFIRLHLSQIRQQQQATRPTYQSQQRGIISKSRLPNTYEFYSRFDITIKGSKGWQLVKCAFHNDTHASMGVNREHGGYKCHACGASGDRIGFYMQWHSTTFIEACKALNLIEGAQ